MNGLVRPQAGTVHVLDYDLANPKTNLRALRQRVGLVFQFPEAQLFERYVGDDVAFGPWQMGIRGKELKDRVAGAMDAVGLAFSTFKDRPIFSLSGGERRRAAQSAGGARDRLQCREPGCRRDRGAQLLPER